ncbi:MAG: hypothetical protein U9P80_06705 [Thermodesulfobacteriota bacterium]|nr:hypothetical protein [Thermodesulfobacteriota bacterium]
MKKERAYRKKDPKYLEDITFSDGMDPMAWGSERDMFSSDLFLGRYSKEMIMDMLKSVGMVDIFQKRGYRDLIISTFRSEEYTSRLYVNFESTDRETRLIELVVREGVFRPKKTFVDGFDFREGISCLLVEWLTLQDPGAAFTAERPRFPSQEYPGLGGLVNMQRLLRRFARKSGKDAIVDVPEQYHAAVMYSHTCSFFSPVDGGKLKNMMRTFSDHPLAMVSFAIASGCMRDENTGIDEVWNPSELIYPTSRKVEAYLQSSGYMRLFHEADNNVKYSIDWERYEQFKAKGIMDEL